MLFKMLFGMSVIIWHSQQAMFGFIFQDLCFKKGKFESSVACKSVVYKKVCNFCSQTSQSNRQHGRRLKSDWVK